MLSHSSVSHENLEEGKHEVSDWTGGNGEKPTTGTDSKSEDKEFAADQGFMAAISGNEVDNGETLSVADRVYLFEEFGQKQQSFSLFRDTWKILDPEFYKHMMKTLGKPAKVGTKSTGLNQLALLLNENKVKLLKCNICNHAFTHSRSMYAHTHKLTPGVQDYMKKMEDGSWTCFICCKNHASLSKAKAHYHRHNRL